jgi:transposase
MPRPMKELAEVEHNVATLFASLELSQTSWLVTSLSPGSVTMSKHSISAGDGAALLGLLARLRTKAVSAAGVPVEIVVIQEAGLDGFWVHRLLEANRIESHVVDAASISVPRRRRRAKTDAIDGETLLRTLRAWKRGEPRVCAMVAPPSPEQEDQRRISRERAILLRERVRHVNRIKGLLASQGITDFEPLHKDRRVRLDALRTGDGRPLPPRLKAELLREIELIELLLLQIAEVETERDSAAEFDTAQNPSPIALLIRLRGIGSQIASVLYFEGLYRHFGNRRAPTPWRSGTIDREQGISKAGNPRLRHIMVELAWLWLRHQPDSARWHGNWPRATDCHRSARSQAADRAVALCQPG